MRTHADFYSLSYQIKLGNKGENNAIILIQYIQGWFLKKEDVTEKWVSGRGSKLLHNLGWLALPFLLFAFGYYSSRLWAMSRKIICGFKGLD